MQSVSSTTTYHTAIIDGLGIFYREAGPRDGPTILLLHGFPSSSRMFNPLIPLLADHYHLVAPDYPGFGHSDAPAPETFTYSFDHLAKEVDQVIDALGLSRYVLFVQDYGGPSGSAWHSLNRSGSAPSSYRTPFRTKKASARSGRHGRHTGRIAVATKRNCGRI